MQQEYIVSILIDSSVNKLTVFLLYFGAQATKVGEISRKIAYLAKVICNFSLFKF